MFFKHLRFIIPNKKFLTNVMEKKESKCSFSPQSSHKRDWKNPNLQQLATRECCEVNMQQGSHERLLRLLLLEHGFPLEFDFEVCASNSFNPTSLSWLYVICS